MRREGSASGVTPPATQLRPLAAGRRARSNALGLDQANLQFSSTLSSNPAAPHDPGGKVRLALSHGVQSHAVFGGPNREFRYTLRRTWGIGPTVMFLMMNPSTADNDADDPTVAKCGRFARHWGFASLVVGNVFAFRATDQRQLARVPDPIGPENDEWLDAIAANAELLVCAYGTPRVKALRQRGPAVARMLMGRMCRRPRVLRLSKDGVPCHPLYLPETLQPQPWTPPAA